MVVGWKIFSLQKCQGSRFQEDTERRVYEDSLHLDKRPVPHAAMNEEYLRENVISKKKPGTLRYPVLNNVLAQMIFSPIDLP
jgi:hypothetical protein